MQGSHIEILCSFLISTYIHIVVKKKTNNFMLHLKIPIMSKQLFPEIIA